MIPLGQDGPEEKPKSYNVPVPAWLFAPDFLDQKAQYLLNPPFVQGPTMILLTLPSTPNRVWPLSPLHPLACSTHDLTTHILSSPSHLFPQTNTT